MAPPTPEQDALDAIPLLSGDWRATTMQEEQIATGRRDLGHLLRQLKGKQASNPESSFAAKLELRSETSSNAPPEEYAGDGEVTRDAAAGIERYYAPIDEYEGRHRYDPRFRWSEPEEKALVRRIDFKICSWVCLMFFALQLDRGNITQALSDNLLDDLKLSTNDYNYGQTIFFISFILAELPSQLISKKIGPDNWIPIQMISWSIVASAQSQITGRGTFFLTRALLGVIEGGFIPDVILYLSYFYKGSELPIRLSFFWGAYGCTYIISSFLAFGILHLRGRAGMAGWQWLFALEGSLTALIGIASWLYLPPSPTQTASFFRGKNGWFSAHEEKIMINRILRDDPSKGDMHNRQAVTPRLLWEALCDYDLWPIYLLGLTWSIPQQPSQAYITLILRSLGFTTFTTNLLTVPGYVLFVLQLMFWTRMSEKINNRFLIIIVTQIYMLPILIALEVLPADPTGLAGTYTWARYVLTVLLVGYPYVHAIIVALTSRNAGSVRTRTVGSALYNMCIQASNIFSSNIYVESDAPLYRKGNRILLSIVAWNMVLIIGTKLYYIWRNERREEKWNRMSEQDKKAYLEGTTDQGNKRLDFRFSH